LEPLSWGEAISSTEAENWQAPANDELRSLVKAEVFHLVPSNDLSRTSHDQQQGLQGEEAGRWID